jgi:hypothetical protein
LSYNGNVFFGVTGDYRTMPDIGILARDAASGIVELHDIACGPRRHPA